LAAKFSSVYLLREKSRTNYRFFEFCLMPHTQDEATIFKNPLQTQHFLKLFLSIYELLLHILELLVIDMTRQWKSSGAKSGRR
jgi:hypothetical protein